jgi:hypothetical protein
MNSSKAPSAPLDALVAGLVLVGQAVSQPFNVIVREPLKLLDPLDLLIAPEASPAGRPQAGP